MLNKLNLKNIFIISALFHLFCSIFSSGFHHYDEHFQIYEFMNTKLGGTPKELLSWEYKDAIRSWFQPGIYYGIAKFFNLLGVNNPFTTAFIFRFLTSLFGLFAFWRLLPTIKEIFRSEGAVLISWFLLNLAWFIPYIHTRTNSESLAISFFALAIPSFFRKQQVSLGTAVLVGLSLGASYLSRYQCGVMIMFFWLHELFLGERRSKLLVGSALGIILMFGVGSLFDYWGYDRWTNSGWNYLRINILENHLAGSSQDPWWYYFKVSFLRGIPPISLPLMLATLYVWVKQWRHPFTWMSLPMFAVHCIIGHKELRYIFPVIAFAGFYAGLFYQDYEEKLKLHWAEKPWLPYLTKFTLGINIILLLGSTLKAANPSVNFYQYLWERAEVKEFIAVDEDPFRMVGLPIVYYRKPELKITEKNSPPKDLKGFVFLHKARYLDEMRSRQNCQMEWLSYPEWVLKFNIGNWVQRSRVWSLWNCQ